MPSLIKLPWFARFSDKGVDHARVGGQTPDPRTVASRASANRCSTARPVRLEQRAAIILRAFVKEETQAIAVANALHPPAVGMMRSFLEKGK